PLMPEMDETDDAGMKRLANCLKQTFERSDADLQGIWKKGGDAIVRRNLGQGQVRAEGALPFTSHIKRALRAVPWARGGKGMLYSPIPKRNDIGWAVEVSPEVSVDLANGY